MLPSCNCETMVIRETNGIDEQQAAIQADAMGERTSIFQELVRLSIVEVDGQRVPQPFTAIDAWNSKTRALIIQAYQRLNSLTDAETAVFLQASEDVEVAAPLAPVPNEAPATATPSASTGE